MFQKKMTALMTAAAMLFCTPCGGFLQQTVSAENDETVYFTVGSVSGTAGSSVPVSVDIRTEYTVGMMGLTLKYDSSLTPVPADPDVPTVPKAEVDMRTSRFARPVRQLHDIFLNPERHEIYPSYTKALQQGTITVWFEIPADAAVGTQYPLNLKADVLSSVYSLTDYLTSSVTNGVITVTGQPVVTTTAAPVQAAFDITEDALDLTEYTDVSVWDRDPVQGYKVYPIPFTASENLDYIEWSTDNPNIRLDRNGRITSFNYEESDRVRGNVTATAHFLDGTVLTDTVSVYAADTAITIDEPWIIGPPEIVGLVTMPPAETTTAKATATTAKAATSTKAVTTTTKAVTTTTKAATTTTRATTTTTKATTTTTRATTTTTKATTTTAKATTTTAKATTTTAKATTTTTKATTTTTKATTTTTKATTTTTKATTTTAKVTTTTAKVTTTTAKATTTTTKATTTTTKATTTTTKATTTTTEATTTTVTTAVTTVTTTAQTTEPAPMTGDVDGDGAVSIEDVQLALKAYTKQVSGRDTGLTERQYKAANVNGDAELSVDDVQNILIYYVNNTVSGKRLTWEELLGGKQQGQPVPRRLKRSVLLRR